MTNPPRKTSKPLWGKEAQQKKGVAKSEMNNACERGKYLTMSCGFFFLLFW